MIQTIRKAWGIPELRKKIVFTLLILLIFRVGNAIPTPYINTELLGAYIDSTGGSLWPCRCRSGVPACWAFTT